MKLYKCKYCGKEYVNAYSLGGHVGKCKCNPDYEKNMLQLSITRTHITHNYENKHLHCKYCGKEIANEGCLTLHERRCKLNPNYEPTEKQQEKILKQQNKQPLHLSEETKKKISNARKKYLAEHKDEHVWKRHNKFTSKPCEILKDFLKSKNISFIEEYTPLDDYNFSLDIAWPDIKVAIEVNGNQHYNRDGSLKNYYQNRHNILENNGWTIFEIHYTKCYNININDFSDILSLDIYDKEYIKQYFDKQYIYISQKQIQKQQRIEEHNKLENEHKSIILNLINNSGIDFSKSTWSQQATNYLEQRGELWNKGIFRCIRKYAPDFLKQDTVWKRKGCKY